MKISYITMLVCFFGTLFANNPEIRTFEYMAKNPWTDHVKHFDKLFRLKKIHSLLEFGVGEGTKFFLDHCDEVTSVELDSTRAGSINRDYYEKCLQLFANYSNWHPQVYECSVEIKNAELFAERNQQNPAHQSALYLSEIKTICDSAFQNKAYDVAFVDPGIIVRGDIVNALFGKVDIIVAHDTSFHPTIYGWSWIKKPQDYERISFFDGSGTTFWIKKTQSELIKELKKYPRS